MPQSQIKPDQIEGPIPVSVGGTNLSTTPTAGQLLIGDGVGYTLNRLTAGAGINITNTAGVIAIASSGGPITKLQTQAFGGL